jgi:HEAT repeat protein
MSPSSKLKSVFRFCLLICVLFVTACTVRLETARLQSHDLTFTALDGSFKVVRRTAAIVLGNSRNPGAGEALLQALKDSQARVRIEAVRALGRTRPGGARAALTAVEANDTDRRVRR